MNFTEFKIWLDDNTTYTKATKSNVISRLKRANIILPVESENVYLFNLSQENEFQCLTVSVKSQIRRAVKLYFQYIDWKDGITNGSTKNS